MALGETLTQDLLRSIKSNTTPAILSKFADTGQLSAFGSLRVVEPVSLFDATFHYDKQPLIFEEITANGGSATHTPAYSAVTLALDGTGSGASAIQARQFTRYVPGKSHLILMTFLFGTGVATVKRRVGYFETGDGIFLEQNGTTDVAFTLRTSTSGSPSDTARVAQSDWNIDKFNGSGPSKAVLDLTKTQILVIDFQWLGVGRVRVGFDIDGKIVYAHEFLNANSIAIPYMKTAVLPLRWAILGDAAASMLAICGSVQSEGGAKTSVGYQFSHSSPEITTANGSQVFVVGYRPAGTFNSIVNRTLYEVGRLSGGSISGTPSALVEVYYNATITAGSWGAVNSSSAMEVNTTASGFSGGTKIASFIIPGGRFNDSIVLDHRYPFCVNSAGSAYANLLVVATGLGGVPHIATDFTWQEVR